MEMRLFTVLVVAILILQFKTIESCLTRAGDQLFLDDPIEEDVTQIYNGVEIYANKYTPDKCNYGEWSKGDYPAAYMRKLRYKGFIAVSKDTERSQTPKPIMEVERLMDIVRKAAKELGANIVCGGHIDKAPYNAPSPNTSAINKFTYEFYGSALHFGPPIPPEEYSSGAGIDSIEALCLLTNIIMIISSMAFFGY